MTSSSSVLGVLGSVIAVVAFVPYLWHMHKGTTKPHVVSWFLWGLLQVIAFFAQISRGAGAGAWVTAVTAALCWLIAILAFQKGETKIMRSDRWVFVGALAGVVLWQITNNPVFAAILVTITDVLAFVPTYRKAYHKPSEETASQYAISAVRSFFSVLALESYSLTTWLYPTSLVITDGLFVVMVLVRRGSRQRRL